METAKITGIVLIAVSAFLIAISLLRRNESYFNLFEVFKKHLSLFKDCKYQYIVFYGFPLLFAVGLALVYEAGAAFYSELSVILGILISMLFTILSILTGLDYSSVAVQKQRENAKKAVKETVNAIVFDSVLSLFLMLYSLAMIILDGVSFSGLTVDVAIIKSILSGAAYYVFAVILLTLLLIVKHMSKIIGFSLQAKKEQ